MKITFLSFPLCFWFIFGFAHVAVTKVVAMQRSNLCDLRTLAPTRANPVIVIILACSCVWRIEFHSFCVGSFSWFVAGAIVVRAIGWEYSLMRTIRSLATVSHFVNEHFFFRYFSLRLRNPVWCAEKLKNTKNKLVDRIGCGHFLLSVEYQIFNPSLVHYLRVVPWRWIFSDFLRFYSTVCWLNAKAHN